MKNRRFSEVIISSNELDLVKSENDMSLIIIKIKVVHVFIKHPLPSSKPLYKLIGLTIILGNPFFTE